VPGIVTTTYPRAALTHYGDINASITPANVLPWFSFINNNENSSVATVNARIASYKSQRPDGVYVSYMIPTEMPEYAATPERTSVRQKIQAEFALGRDWLLRQKGTRLLIGSFGVRTQINWCAEPDAAGLNPACALFKAKYDGWYATINTDGIWFDGGAPYPGVTTLSQPYPISTAGYGQGQAGGSTTVLKLQVALTAPQQAKMVGRKVNGLFGLNAGLSRVITSCTDSTTLNFGVAWAGSWATASEFYIISGYQSQGSTTFTTTTATDPSASWDTNEWTGGFVECGTELREVISNTATVLTIADAWTSTPSSTTAFDVFAAPGTDGGAAVNAINTSDQYLHMNADPYYYEGADSAAQSQTSPRWTADYLARGKEMLAYARSYPISLGRTRWMVGGNGTVGVVRGHEFIWDHHTYEGMIGFGGSDYSLADREQVLQESAEFNRTQAKVEDGYVPCGLCYQTGTPAYTLNAAGWDNERSAFVAMQMIGSFYMQYNTGYSSAPKRVLNEIKLLSPGFGGTTGWGAAVDGIQNRKAAGKEYWRREFANVLCIWNPSRTVSVQVNEPGWKRFDAATIFAAEPQSPTINNGSTTMPFTLAADQGIVLIKV
jgi:hypothetical protein